MTESLKHQVVIVGGGFAAQFAKRYVFARMLPRLLTDHSED